MRIVNLDEFLKLPADTLFHKYGSMCCFEGLAVKVDNIGDRDFLYNYLNGAIKSSSSEDLESKLEKAEGDSSVSLTLDFDNIERDGLFAEEQLFAVYEKVDILDLVTRLSKCL